MNRSTAPAIVALRVLAFIAANHPNWEPGETPEALAADPIAADLWACGVALTLTDSEFSELSPRMAETRELIAALAQEVA
jgi:hypothetical protein